MDLSSESLISLTEAAKILPARATGKPVNIRTIEKWIKAGNRNGIKLEGLLLGGRLVTTKEALVRFGQASLEAESTEKPVAKPPKANARSKAFLASRGIGAKPKS